MFKSITLEVVGDQPLHCESCERRVERLLKPLNGVSKVRAQASNQHIEVLFDDSELNAAALVESLSKAGYETRVSE